MKTVFIGSSSYETIDKKYIELSKEVALLCVKKDYKLKYGASSKSMMGTIYNTFMGNNKKVLGVQLETYKEDAKDLNCELVMVDSTLKQVEIFSKSDILLFLPGGIGTLNEIVNSITLKRNKEINGKIIIFNYDNFFDYLFKFISSLEEKSFSKKEELFKIVNTMEELKKELN
ncbi:MAG: LOG family protein [Bacilli bacterium]|nr:LOG family protein [Bacilli bacterium]